MLIATFVRCLSFDKKKSTQVLSVAVVIPVMGEPREPGAVQVNSQRLVAGAEGVDSHVELSASVQQRVEQVLLADIVFDAGVAGGCLPLCDVVDVLEDKDALSLAFGSLD